MLSRATPVRQVLGFTPLPEHARRAIYDSLVERGFAQEAILDDYRFTGRDGAFTLNCLAFADRTRRTPAEYAGCAVYNAANDLNDNALVTILAQTAAPFHIIHHQDTFSLWTSTLKDQSIQSISLGADITYDNLSQILREYKTDFEPKQIVDVKQGRSQFVHPHLRKIEPLQLALWAIEATRETLVDTFGQAVAQLRNDVGEKTGQADRTITDFAIRMLGATILADTGVFGETIRQRGVDLSLDQLLSVANTSFPNYFQHHYLDHNDLPGTDLAYRILRRISYSGFAPEMLSYLYTAAYGKAQRKKLGFYDTPLYLTRRILQNIPIEFLPPEERLMVDMGCGWGSFLIAGAERLGQMNDMRGRSLRDHIIGNDIDPFTAQLAGLGLLLSTAEDSWHIDHHNALTWPWLETHQPGIIVGNPPFGGRRDQPETLDELMPATGRTRVEAANDHLYRTVRCVRPGGYIAMIMPQSFLVSESAPHIRQALIETCDILEVWQLPGQLFSGAQIQPMALFAQKRKVGQAVNYPVRVRNLQKQNLPNFESTGMFTASTTVSDQSRWRSARTLVGDIENMYTMDVYSINSEEEWRKVYDNCIFMSNVISIFSGAIKGKKTTNKRHVNSALNRTVPFLTNARRVMPTPWLIDYQLTEQVLYPGDFEEPRLAQQSIFEGAKVLMVASPNPSWGLRSKAAVERRGHYPSFSFYVLHKKEVVPSQHLNEETIAAVLNWYVCNAWVAEHRSYPKIELRVLKTLPFPRNLRQVDVSLITEAVHHLEQAAISKRPPPIDAQETIDRILKTAYNLDDATYTRLRTVAAWDEQPQITLDPQPDRTIADYLISGVVDSVQADQGTMILWISGFDDLQTVPIDPLMPGWLLRPEVSFRAKIPFNNKRKRTLEGVIWNDFTPQQYTYLDEASILRNLGSIFGDPEDRKA